MPTAGSKKKKVLIVSFNFPPTNSVGAMRVGKFAKYLPEFGWEPVVLTVNKARSTPQTLPLEIAEAKVVRTPYHDLITPLQRKQPNYSIFTAYIVVPLWKRVIDSWRKPLRIIQELPLVRVLLSPSIGWYPQAVKKGLEVIGHSDIKLIFSSSPPPTSHLIASRLQRKTGLPWVAEFRDLWSLNQYRNRTEPFHFMEKQWEKRVLKRSRLLITVSAPLAEQLEKLHSKKTLVITNGFDAADYEAGIPLTSKFTITYTGNIYPGKRDPTLLFEAISKLHQEGRVTPDNFELRFFGQSLANTPSLIQNYYLGEIAKIYGFIPFEESIRRQQESTVLLSLGWNDPREQGVYTGKIFTYLGAGRPIMALGLKGDVVGQLLNETGTGVMMDTSEKIKAVLSKWLEEFGQSGSITSYYNPNGEAIQRYTRKKQGEQLAGAFEQALKA